MKDIILHRIGGLQLTRRWGEADLPVVPEEDWKGPVHAIYFTTGFEEPIEVRVRETVAYDGDKTGRIYTAANGVPTYHELPVYGITDPFEFRRIFRDHVHKYALVWAAAQKGDAYAEALRLIHSVRRQPMTDVLRYEFARFYKTGSAYIVGGDTLGIAPVPADARSLSGKAPLPRLITAQGDRVITLYLNELVRTLFGQAGSISRTSNSDQPCDIHDSYVALRVLVFGSIWYVQDRLRHGQQNGVDGPSVPESVQQVQGSLSAVVSALNHGVLGKDYPKLLERLSPPERDFHRRIQKEPPAGEAEWANPLYLLPSLKDLCEGLRPERGFTASTRTH